MKNFTRFAASLTAFALVGSAGIASAEVGKKISVASNLGTVIAGIYPALTTAVSVAIPKSYKSKANFLKITSSYQAICLGGDALASEVLVGGSLAAPSGFLYEAFDEDAGYQIVTKVYYLLPESMGGPAIPPESLVEVRLTSNSGSCGVGNAVLTVEAAK